MRFSARGSPPSARLRKAFSIAFAPQWPLPWISSASRSLPNSPGNFHELRGNSWDLNGTGRHKIPGKSRSYRVSWSVPGITGNGEWCPGVESNYRHHDFQSCALPTELPGHLKKPAYRGERRSLSRRRSGVEIIVFQVVRQLHRRHRVDAGKPPAKIDFPAAGRAERTIFCLAGLAAYGAGVGNWNWPGSSAVTAGQPRYRMFRVRGGTNAPGRFVAREWPRAPTSPQRPGLPACPLRRVRR